MTTNSHFRRQRLKAASRIGKVMKHAYRECIIERLPEWQIVDIRLNDVGVLHLPGRGVRGFNCGTKIDTNNVSCRPLRNKLVVSSFTTATFEYNLVLKE